MISRLNYTRRKDFPVDNIFFAKINKCIKQYHNLDLSFDRISHKFLIIFNIMHLLSSKFSNLHENQFLRFGEFNKCLRLLKSFQFLKFVSE